MAENERDESLVKTEIATPRARVVETADTVIARHSPAPIAAGPDGALAPHGPRHDADFEERYSGGDLLGKGGMGEVRQYIDSVIGRPVAVKSLHLRDGGAEAGARFLREARVQGQLQHPAIVPVYDLGVDDNGATFFTMKKLGGRTLLENLTDLREEAERGERQRQLLNDFADVCQAVDYAHSRGVVHRDLKPANIMLGDFGEVYVLDWGLARLADDPTAPAASGEVISEAVGVTSSKTVMGTVGYMAPEQLCGDPISAATDVYALGAILFEILTLEPLHTGSSSNELSRSTLEGATDRILERADVHAVAPELAELCALATRVKPEERLSTAHEFHSRLERFLAGDRDLLRRVEMAAELSAKASEAAALALQEGDLEARREAMRTASRSLALDPDQAAAPQILMSLLLSPPRERPDEVRDMIRRKRSENRQHYARLASAAYISWLVALPFFLWMGIVDWTLGVAMIGTVVTCAAASLVAGSRRRVRTGMVIAGVALNALTLFLLTRLLGPLILVPTLAVSTSLAFTLYGHWAATLFGPLAAITAVAAAVLCEALGVLPTSYTFADGEMRVVSSVLELPAIPTTITLTLLVVAAVGVAAWFVASIKANLDRAEAENMTMLWQYRQLAPGSE